MHAHRAWPEFVPVRPSMLHDVMVFSHFGHFMGGPFGDGVEGPTSYAGRAAHQLQLPRFSDGGNSSRHVAACSGGRARMGCLLDKRSKGVGAAGGFFMHRQHGRSVRAPSPAGYHNISGGLSR